MPVLPNQKHERFAQEMAKGNSANKAYVLAGYKPDDGNCIRLTGVDRIRSRVTELLEKAAEKTGITLESITRMLQDDRSLAYKLGQSATAVSAATALAKLYGLWIEKSERVLKYETMTDAELDATIERLDREAAGHTNRAASGLN